jgi:Ca2+-binding RTX toxin-like protein
VTLDAATGNVLVAGTPANDTVSFSINAAGQLLVTYQIGNNPSQTYGPFAGASKIILNLGDGDDTVIGNKLVLADMEVYGGDGNDTITGGGGDDILVGGNGNDSITAGLGRDIILGSDGEDYLFGKQGQDIVVAGTTAYDSNPTALAAIQAEWNSGRNFDTRVKNIFGGNGSAVRLNGSYFLRPTASLITGPATVFDDGDKDTLTGGGGKDWLLFNYSGSGILDVVTDLTGADLITDLI